MQELAFAAKDHLFQRWWFNSRIPSQHSSPAEISWKSSKMAATCGSASQNGIVQALLTDLYQVSMAYAYWESGKTHEHSTFDLFFRTNPFQGEFTIFAGLHDCLMFLKTFRFTESGKVILCI